MPLELNAERAVLRGHADINTVEELLGWLLGRPDPVVDLTDAASVHMGILQVLLATRPRLVMAGEPVDTPSDWRHILVRSGLSITLAENT